MRSRPEMRTSLGFQMLSIREASCFNPVDRVYGILWLLHEHIRKQIIPDYTSQAQHNYAQVFSQLSLLALNEDQGLATLSLACTQEKIPGMPSWCSNLESVLDFDIFHDCYAGGRETPEFGPHIACSIDRKQILIRGRAVDVIADILLTAFHPCFIQPGRPQCTALLLEWFQDCVRFALNGGNTLAQLERVLSVDRLCDRHGDKVKDKELMILFRDMLQIWLNIFDSSRFIAPDETAQRRITETGIHLKVLEANRGRRLIRTRCGHLGLVHHSARRGDAVCIFRGTQAALMFRADHDVYQFISDAWILGLMGGEALNSDTGEEEFWIS